MYEFLGAYDLPKTNYKVQAKMDSLVIFARPSKKNPNASQNYYMDKLFLQS